MQRGSVFLVEPVSRIKRQELDFGSFRQIRGLIDDKPTGPDASFQCHGITVPCRIPSSKPGGNLFGSVLRLNVEMKPTNLLAADVPEVLGRFDPDPSRNEATFPKDEMRGRYFPEVGWRQADHGSMAAA